MNGPAFFIAEDGDGEPTLWQANSVSPDYPLPVVRRCDLSPIVRPEGWAFLEAAVAEAEAISNVRALCDENEGNRTAAYAGASNYLLIADVRDALDTEAAR